ncbi:hypothetical protein ONZ45_g16858 [Pleurotus djamor]|nr:hypothetical protein ONZ45_g16858 [Pleurotus djamor]
MVKAAWATLITPRDPGYIAGLLIVKQCLQDVESQYPLVAMVTPDVAPEILALLSRHGILITPVDYLLPGVDSANTVDTRFADAWTKLRAFGLYDYEFFFGMKRVVLFEHINAKMLLWPTRVLSEMIPSLSFSFVNGGV